MNTANPKPLPLIDSIQRPQTVMGTLNVTIGKQCIALPLKQVAIETSIAGFVSEVTMRQVFQNPYEEPLEAVYVFPLSGSAAINRFDMKVGNRTIHGIVKEREEARKEYQRALDEGKRAGLLEKERDDVFTIQVGNLPPGEEVEVLLQYSESLPFLDNGATELRLPLVVAPRYIPGQPLCRDEVGDGVENDTDIVPDASRITPPRFAPGLKQGVSLKIDVEILNPTSAGVADLCCSQHAIRTQTENGAVSISLSQEDELMDRDFILRWRVAGEKIESALLVHQEEDGSATGMLSIVPARQNFSQVPRDVVFILDRSGSMEGIKMVSAARACAALLNSLNSSDRFCILAFDNEVERFPGEKRFIHADESGRDKGQKYLHGIQARGGTEMYHAFRDALETLKTREESQKAVFILITDGQVGDESRILQLMQTELGRTRVFTVGVDTAVNQAFLRRLATLGGGTSSFVEPGTRLEEALEQVAREIGNPLITDLKMEGIDSVWDFDSMTPERLPDLFAGRPVMVLFQIKRWNKIRISGCYPDGSLFEQIVEAEKVPIRALPHLWARSRVMDLEDRFRIDRSRQHEWKQKIIDLALKYSLLTRFTAFVVIDETEIVNADGTRRRVVQPVAMPAKWEMDSDMAHHAPVAYMSMQPAAYRMQDLSSALSGPAEWFEATTEKISSAIQERKRKKNERRIVKDFLNLLDSLHEILKRFSADIDAGMNPSAEKLESLRTKLIQALVAANLDLELAQLLEFLMKDARELVLALQTPDATTLKSVFEQNVKTFEKIRKEALERINGKKNDSSTRFWESSI